MTTYSAEVNIYNHEAIADAVEEAADAHKAYITDISGDGIWVTPPDAKPVNGAAAETTTGWHISDVLEYFKRGASWIKLWIESGVAKLRLGTADGFNTKLSNSKIAFCSGDSEIATLKPMNRSIYPSAWGKAVDTGYWQDSAYGSIGNSLSFASLRGYCEDKWGASFDSAAAWKYMLKGSVYISGSYKQVLVRLSDIRDVVAASYSGTPYAFLEYYSGRWLCYTSNAIKVYTGSAFMSYNVRHVSMPVESSNIMDLSCGINAHGSISASGALFTGDSVLTRGNLGFDSGSVVLEATANSCTDAAVSFSANAAFSSAPIVVCGFYSSSSAAAFGGLACSVHSITATGCKVRVFNSTASDRVPGIQWIAVGS